MQAEYHIKHIEKHSTKRQQASSLQFFGAAGEGWHRSNIDKDTLTLLSPKKFTGFLVTFLWHGALSIFADLVGTINWPLVCPKKGQLVQHIWKIGTHRIIRLGSWYFIWKWVICSLVEYWILHLPINWPLLILKPSKYFCIQKTPSLFRKMSSFDTQTHFASP